MHVVLELIDITIASMSEAEREPRDITTGVILDDSECLDLLTRNGEAPPIGNVHCAFAGKCSMSLEVTAPGTRTRKRKCLIKQAIDLGDSLNEDLD